MRSEIPFRKMKALLNLASAPTQEDIWNVRPRISCKNGLSEDFRLKDPFEKSNETINVSFWKSDLFRACIAVCGHMGIRASTRGLWATPLYARLATPGTPRCLVCEVGVDTFYLRSSRVSRSVPVLTASFRAHPRFPKYPAAGLFSFLGSSLAFPFYSIII